MILKKILNYLLVGIGTFALGLFVSQFGLKFVHNSQQGETVFAILYLASVVSVCSYIIVHNAKTKL